ncbi:RagB/SusD family nutrient uptake outer membrane protein [Sphingobacterium bambusae]|uniref:RagB/SusD family nutrient uptake outer membrane protein n=1 Tax=Sphingobacterium bambusae TaxID=662858 RepID=A0ABW6BGW6_9SPHI|nr:RagB/SusD family nutrient uptake outer membrane protein [Sphingobacterium bambusae]WPL49484.1 RagB/SusD family nutrient uptake outer membrane protein [Sphingobacterium bambusae]
MKQIDQYPNDQLATETFFTNANDALLALNGCYGYLDGNQDNIYFEAMSDNAFAQYPWESAATEVSAGNITVNTDLGYGRRYEGIRRFNYFISQIENVQMSEELKKRYKAEVRFLRAYSYANLTTIFGPVPLIVDALENPQDAKIEPTAELQVVEFVLSELGDIVNDLPTSYSGGGGNEYGRITRSAALALRSRIALFYKNYNIASSSAKQVMDLNIHTLFEKDPSSGDLQEDYSDFVTFANDAEKQRFYRGLVSYTQQFWSINERNSEVILTRQYAVNINKTLATTKLFPAALNGWSSVTPTQSLVDAYGDRNGDPVTNLPTPAQRNTNYNNGAFGAAYLTEFKNRDTRLYASILFPGNSLFVDGKVQEFSWGKGGNNNSKTGYNFRKIADPNYIQEQNGDSDFQLLRYAEVLLTFAEAENELNGPSVAVYEAVNLVRSRAGMPDVDQARYGSKNTLRTLIQNERRIELAGEGQRFWDIRRLAIAAEVMKDIRDITNETTQARKWEPRYYYMPYPLTAMDRNPNLQTAQKEKGY